MIEFERQVQADDKLASQEDYRLKLKTRFLTIKKRNPNFSIAVLARQVGCSPSFIKKLFACRAHLGFRYAEKLAQQLELSQNEEEALYLIVILHSVDGESFRDLMRRLILKSRRSE